MRTLADGRYRAEVLSHALAESKEKGTPSVKVHFAIKYNVSFPEDEINGVSMYADLWLSEKCFKRTMHALTKIFGWKGTNISELNDNPELLSGAECILVIENEIYQDISRPKIKFVNDIKKTMDPEKAANLAKKLQEKVLEYKTQSPGVGANISNNQSDPNNQDAPPYTDDDLPF